MLDSCPIGFRRVEVRWMFDRVTVEFRYSPDGSSIDARKTFVGGRLDVYLIDVPCMADGF